MCGRYHIDTEEDIIGMREIIDEINRKYNGTEALASMKTGEVFPTNMVPVVAESGAEIMIWGFPMHGKSQSIINARAETIFERPMFKTAVAERRAAIPTTGFYEWRHAGKRAKEKFLFRLLAEKMLYLAGIYTEFNLPEGKQTRFSIITTAANESMRPYHDRMPVHIRQGELDAWIGDSRFSVEAMRREQPEFVALLVLKNGPGIEQTSLL